MIVRRFVIVVGLLLLVGATSAIHADPVFLQSDWNADFQAVQFLVGDPMEPDAWQWVALDNGFSVMNSSLISAQAVWMYDTYMVFRTSAEGWAIPDNELARVTTPLTLSDYYHGVRFNWRTDWPDAPAAQHLRMEVMGVPIGWSEGMALHEWTLYPGQGVQTGHVELTGMAYSSLIFEVAVAEPVPEPSSMVMLGSGVAVLAGLIRRRR